jgi:hypothetical protein
MIIAIQITVLVLFFSSIVYLVLKLSKKKGCPGDGKCSSHGTRDPKTGNANAPVKPKDP